MDSAAPRRRRCIVCSSPGAHFFIQLGVATYWRCPDCQATFIDPVARLSRKAEHQRYGLHRNDPDDSGYRRFLNRLAVPLLRRITTPGRGLDYGCGPGPALAVLISAAGHQVQLYDPLFFPQPLPFNDCFDFITCSETIEHFHRPYEEFARLDRMLRPGGWLGLSTCFQTDDTLFADWHYRRDPTHVVFYRQSTLQHIARRFGWQCLIPSTNIALMEKKEATGQAPHQDDKKRIPWPN